MVKELHTSTTKAASTVQARLPVRSLAATCREQAVAVRSHFHKPIVLEAPQLYGEGVRIKGERCALILVNSSHLKEDQTVSRHHLTQYGLRRLHGMEHSIACMEDGIFATDMPHLYRVHSSSGAVEYRLVDVAACLCSCPNNGLMCSHRYAVVVAMPQYSIRFGLVLMVRLLCPWHRLVAFAPRCVTTGMFQQAPRPTDEAPLQRRHARRYAGVHLRVLQSTASSRGYTIRWRCLRAKG